MSTPSEKFDEVFKDILEQNANIDFTSEAGTAFAKNIKTFSEARPPQPEPTIDPDPVPETRWGKMKLGVAKIWDNETTRVLIKAGGAFAGVAVVAYSTVHKDHVIERQALAQANQRN